MSNRIEMMNLYQRRQFDPSSKEDLKAAKKFLHNNKWENGCPFHLEWPYADIPYMLKTKITEYALKGLK
jgi:hypothetical protein